jgi:hypothetical protein
LAFLFGARWGAAMDVDNVPEVGAPKLMTKGGLETPQEKDTIGTARKILGNLSKID